MDEDLKNLEEKISKLIALCGSLREENTQLREKSDTLKSNMEQASVKLEGLLDNLPQREEVV
ncbi:MAG: cell division protein ZapB [Methylophilaceae bacterium]